MAYKLVTDALYALVTLARGYNLPVVTSQVTETLVPVPAPVIPDPSTLVSGINLHRAAYMVEMVKKNVDLRIDDHTWHHIGFDARRGRVPREDRHKNTGRKKEFFRKRDFAASFWEVELESPMERKYVDLLKKVYNQYCGLQYYTEDWQDQGYIPGSQEEVAAKKYLEDAMRPRAKLLMKLGFNVNTFSQEFTLYGAPVIEDWFA